MIHSFSIHQTASDFLQIFSNDIGKRALFNFITYSDGKENIPFKMEVQSTDGVQIQLWCFKSYPPPPSFRPCPEAGQIKIPDRLPKEGRANFSLRSTYFNQTNERQYERETEKFYSLHVFDDESHITLNIQIR